jgi:pimeloyl-ACP methyl ester carboxylesterase/CRP-like cAMP-binding protein
VREARAFTVAGETLTFVEQGDPSLQTALLIHGWSSSWYAMVPLMDLLSRRFHVVVVNLPGYGSSAPLRRRDTSIMGYADLLSLFLSHISDGPAVIVGHSMGGMIALTMALDQPALIERLVLLSPTISGRLSRAINFFVWPVTMMERFGLGSYIVSAVEHTFVGITDRIMKPVSFAAAADIDEEHYRRLRADARQPGQGRIRAESFWAMRDHDLTGRLQNLTVPGLVIWGAEDNTVPLRDAGVIAREWPDADLRILPNAGHWPHFEQTAQTRRLVANYLGIPGRQHEKPITAQELLTAQEVADFLANSDVGGGLGDAQRLRLAAQFRQHLFHPGDAIVDTADHGQELYLVKHGTVEIWRTPPSAPGDEVVFQEKVTTLKPGQMTGEVAMLDGGRRSATLVAGPQGAVVLSLERERLLALCADDNALGTRVLWNIAHSMTRRMRFMLWQIDAAQLAREAENDKVEPDRAASRPPGTARRPELQRPLRSTT